MVTRSIVPVVLCGGDGTRLWPVSNAARPKQYHSLVGAETLLQETMRRAAGVHGSSPPIIVCNHGHRFAVADQLTDIGVEAGVILLEPCGRNTAPAVACAALLAIDRAVDESDPLLLVLSADHVILNSEAFYAAIAVAVGAAEQGYLVTFGVLPTKPETGYGYLRTGVGHGDWSEIAEFVEKPDLATATRYVDSGQYLWNSGMFLLPARAYLDELQLHEPRMVAAVEAALGAARIDPDFTRLGPTFADSPAVSIDYAVMERTRKAAVVPLDAGWSDIGSWAALHEVLDKDADGNVLRGNVVVEDCRNSYIAAHARLVGAVGLDGIVVVETDESVLVMRIDDAQRLKDLVGKLKQ
jgi:mannose-1-phosphate guanylyltransferase/mannose-6-phosphate isomerase